ncbi:MAG: HI0074 family nucleotidyltransferase substrate-binding subunit [Bdellovibrionota bacterium]
MSEEKKKIKYDNLKKATRGLEKAILKCESLKSNPELREYIRDSAIQRFEFTFELAWKTLKRFLEIYMLENVDSLIASNLFRMGAESGLIQNSEFWLEFKRNRNLTSYTYDEDLAEKVYENSKIFLVEVKYFIKKLEEKIV